MSSATRTFGINNDFEAQNVTQNYMVCVDVIKAKDLFRKNSRIDGSFVKINLGTKTHLTKVKFHNEFPYFDEYFVFDLNVTRRSMLSSNIIFSVMHFSRIKSNTIGCTFVSIADVWMNPDQYRDKWITLMKSPSVISGYLNVTITVLNNGFEDVNRNELIIDYTIRNRLSDLRTNYIFKIYKYVEFPLARGYDTVPTENWKFKHNYFIRITVNNITKSTQPTVIVKNGELIWNQRIIFCNVSSKDMIVIALCKPGIASKIIASTEFDANLFAPHSETDHKRVIFGPNYLNLYKSNKKRDECHSFIYTGSLLFSLEECVEQRKYLKELDKSIKSLDETEEDITLFCSVLELSMLDEKLDRNEINIAITLGTATKLCVNDDMRENFNVHRINGVQAEFSDQISIICAIDKILQKSEIYLHDIEKHLCDEKLLAYQVFDTINSVYDFIEAEIDSILHDAKINGDVDGINYYVQIHCLLNKIKAVCNTLREDVNTIINKIRDDNVADVIDDVKRNVLTFANSNVCIRKMSRLIACSWPDIVIWLMYHDHPLAYHRVLLQNIIYSSNEKYYGEFCGIIQNVFMQPISCPTRCYNDFSGCHCISAKAEVVMWLGLSSDEHRFIDSNPCGYKIASHNDSRIEKLSIIAPMSTVLECQVYIYRAIFYDKRYLSNVFIKIYFNKHVKMSKVIKDNLNPVWNETLTFAPIDVCNTYDRLKNNPPSVVIEVCCGNVKDAELIGRIGVMPFVKLSDGSDYVRPSFEWFELYKGSEKCGKILLCSQIVEMKNGNDSRLCRILPPKLDRFRIDVLFWGIRDLKNVHNLLRKFRKIKISIEMWDLEICSDVISGVGNNMNFYGNKFYNFFEAPVDMSFFPTISIKLYEKISSNKFKLYGHGFVDRPDNVFIKWMSMQDRISSLINSNPSRSSIITSSNLTVHERDDINESYPTSSKTFVEPVSNFGRNLTRIIDVVNILKHKSKKSDEIELISIESDDDDDVLHDYDNISKHKDDWWSIFYKSLEEADENPTIEIFDCVLERVSRFQSFNDWCETIDLYKTTKSDSTIDICRIKCGIKIFSWNVTDDVIPVTDDGVELKNCYFDEFPLNNMNEFIVRIYVVRCMNLRPKDSRTNSCDPYLKIALGKIKIDDVNNYQRKTIHPIFGRSYELRSNFIDGYKLIVSVYDHDIASKDDLIGRTEIDLENRYYSKHRGACGLAKVYKSSGGQKWRDIKKPSEILNDLCIRNHLDVPKLSPNSVIFNKNIYSTPIVGTGDEILENICLDILHRWDSMPIFGYPLVHEHVETRSLYHHKKYRKNEQGKIQMWVDIFPDGHILKPMVDISPRTPEDMELRIIVWSTDEVVLDEYDFFTGARVSDIYVKAWFAERSNVQRTDIHYRSLTGEGLFNWRMIFPFKFSTAERKVVVGRHAHLTESSVDMLLPKLFLMAMDNDTLSRDDFLGSLSLNLSECPRGARTASTCNLDIMKGPVDDLFQRRKMRGWWPIMMRNSQGNLKLTGKIDLEMQILSKQTADENPAGKGRKSPNPLPKPLRPEASFSWCLNPLQGLKYVLWHRGRKFLFGIIAIAILITLIVSALYSIPKFAIKKVMKA